jgi:hypothetical protein
LLSRGFDSNNEAILRNGDAPRGCFHLNFDVRRCEFIHSHHAAIDVQVGLKYFCSVRGHNLPTDRDTRASADGRRTGRDGAIVNFDEIQFDLRVDLGRNHITQINAVTRRQQNGQTVADNDDRARCLSDFGDRDI